MGLLSIALFVYLIQKASQGMRPISVLTRVAADTRKVIHNVYPDPFTARKGSTRVRISICTPAGRTIAHSGRPGVMLAFDAAGLVEIARQAGGKIELVPQIGDFLAAGEDLFRLHGAGMDKVNDGGLRRCIALGSERIVENDPAFGFRILVDIASKALSPAINDPTTGVLAIDQIHHLLHLLGQRQLDTGVGAIPPERYDSCTARLAGKTSSPSP